jgi:hypothetical protein
MVVPTRLTLAALAGLGLSQGLTAQEPPRLGVEAGRSLAARPHLSANQKIANTIADHLRQSGQLRHYAIDVLVQNGTVEVTGRVADQQPREEALRLVQGVPGVERVLDRMTFAAAPLRQAQAMAPAQQEPAPLPRKATGGASAPAAGPVEPMPLGGACAGGPYDVGAPHMPPYAWPTYAPYNNFSRVAYPQFYPHNAWPYIGPNYPFPKVPLSWRKVSLEWQDGHWWYGKKVCGHDWWRLRYW